MIDEAQKNISALSGQVVSLQQVLSNKQARGAFGQAQMEEIVREVCRRDQYDFQFTLSNRNRPDCVIRIPGNKALHGDRFQISAGSASRPCARPTSDEDTQSRAWRRCAPTSSKHVKRHRREIPDPRRGADPGDHVRAVGIDLCRAARQFSARLIQKAHRQMQVVVVSPNILMLAINTIQTVMTDARMREQAAC